MDPQPFKIEFDRSGSHLTLYVEGGDPCPDRTRTGRCVPPTQRPTGRVHHRPLGRDVLRLVRLLALQRLHQRSVDDWHYLQAGGPEPEGGSAPAAHRARLGHPGLPEPAGGRLNSADAISARQPPLLAYAATLLSGGYYWADRPPADLTVGAQELGLPGVEVTWLGVAGFAITCEGTTVLIDPLLPGVRSENSWRRVWSSDRARRPLRPQGRCHPARGIPTSTTRSRAGASPRDGATVYGAPRRLRSWACTACTARLSRSNRVRTYEIGPFDSHVVPSVHSKLVLGLKVPNGGEITCEHLDGMTPQAYCCGQVWG